MKLFKLEKLKIDAYKDRRRQSKIGTFTAMFNPESFSQTFEIEYLEGAGFNSSGKEVDYRRSKPKELSLKLIIDGTGVISVSKTVPQQITKFLDLTFRYNGDIHEPNYLTISWGDLKFACRLLKVDINYTLFNRDGTPLRAELNASFLADSETKKRMAKENKSSPDLTHIRIVRSGDKLPLMAQHIYNDPAYYIRIAQANKLNNFRKLKEGSTLRFPPIKK